MKRTKITMFCLVTAMMFCLSGCLYTEEVVPNALEEGNGESVVMNTAFEDNQTAVVDEIRIDGEDFKLVCTYDTKNYPLNEWRVTSKKAIDMSVQTKGLPDGYQVHIEHVHADMMIRATQPNLDGINQDSMDDSDHRTPTKGFPIGNDTSYHNIFLIEGYTNQFYEMWGYCYGKYGNVSSTYKRMTEGNIRKEGAYAQELAVVYDIVITPPGEAEGYVRSVYSSVLIPLVSEVDYVQKDFFTGEIVTDGTE